MIVDRASSFRQCDACDECSALCVCVQGFEIGSGFLGARMTGSEHNDPFYMEGGAVRTRSNRWGTGAGRCGKTSV
jgi:chorismate synthase